MSSIKTHGIIIAESNLGDYDKMLTMLTPDLGKISCVSKGARRPQSLLLAGSQLLSFGEYILFKGTNTYHVNSCEMIESFYNLRTDLDKLKYAVHIDKIIQDVTDENQNSYKILQLLLNTLYVISETDKNLDLVLSVFKLRLACILGFTPKISNCINCGQNEKLYYFSIKDDGVKCEACAKQDKSSIRISESTFLAIKYIIMSPAKKLYSFNLKEESLRRVKYNS